MSDTRTLRILSVNQWFYPDSFGGIERVSYETARRLAARGHVIDLVGERRRADTPDVEELYGVTVHRYGSCEQSRRFGGRTIGALYRSRPVIAGLLAENRYDLVLGQHQLPMYAYLRTARRKTVPEVQIFHASYWRELRLEGAERNIGKPLETLLYGTLVKRAEAAGLRRADRVVILSDFSREQLLAYHPFVDGKIVKIAGGVDLERFRPAADRAALRRELGLPADRQILFTARRLVPRMGLENLIVGFAEARGGFPSALLVIAGRGRLEDDLRRLVAAHGLTDAVSFVGFVHDDELVKHYQVADLFVLPSLAFEGFGMVTLEALSCGTPVIGTPIGATPELLRPLSPQLLLSGTEPPAIRRGIHILLEWLSDAKAAEELRARCRAYVEERYGWDRAVDALEELFLALVAGGAGS